MPTCSECKQEITCPKHQGFGHEPLDEAVVSCSQKCSIWVRAIDDRGAPVPGLEAECEGKSDITGETGFAKLEDLPEGKRTVTLSLEEDPAQKYQPLRVTSRSEKLAKGDIKLIIVTLAPRVKPVLSISEPLVAVKGREATLTLTTDLPYTGKGTLTCTAGADKLEFEPSLEGGKLDVESVPSGGQKVTVKAKDASELEGITFEWKIDPDVQKGDAATGKMTAMKATLDVFKRSGDKATSDLVIHLQSPDGKRRRAKAELGWAPKGVEGTLTLANADGRLAIYDGDTAGNVVAEVTITKEAESAIVYLEGAKVSDAKDDAELILGIKDRCDSAASAKLTVVDTKLLVCVPRVKGASGDPTPIDEDKKADPGRALYLQGPQRGASRALVRVLKVPVDAPCDVLLKAAADHVTLWDREHVDKSEETKVTLPKTLAASDFAGVDKGFVAWAQGDELTSDRRALTIEVPEVEDVTDTIAFTVGLTKITVEIVRSDSNALSKEVKVGLKEKLADSPSETKDYTDTKITFEVAPGTYLFALTPQDQEADFKILRTVPDGSLESAVVAGEEAATEVKFTLQPAPEYDWFQFIGYEIQTGPYMGLDTTPDTDPKDPKEARKDFTGRCTIMKEAVDDAYSDADPDKKTMKIFVAPEFYFRGVQGAYPVGALPEIAANLREHIKDAKFEDWLFVFGSAIGMLEHSPNKNLKDVTSVTLQAPPPNSAYFSCKTKPLPTHLLGKYDLVSNTWAGYSTFTVTATVGDRHEVLFTTAPTPPGPNELVLLLDAGNTMLDQPTYLHCIHGAFEGKKIPEGVMLEQGGNTGFVVSATVDTTGKTCEIFADFPSVVAGTDLKLTRLGETEIFNVVYVQQGGPGTPMSKDGSAAPKDLLIYKETTSQVDFQGPDYNKQDFYRAHRHATTLSGKLNRTLPTQGSTDVLGKHPNKMGEKRTDDEGNATGVDTSEENRTGVGGGVLFSLDGLDFGVECCLDHGNGRLKATTKQVHIQLIPSCGMDIDDAQTSLVPEGFVFNVDGATSHHTKLQRESSVITLPTGKTFAGTNRATFFPKDGKIFVYPRQENRF